MINHQRAFLIRIKFRDHSRLFHQSLKKRAAVERVSRGYFGSWGNALVAVAVVERLKKSMYYELSAGTKKSGCCREATVNGHHSSQNCNRADWHSVDRKMT